MKKVILFLTLLCSINSANALDIKAKAYILKDLNTGKILASKNENRYLPPASTTKLMTLYLLFDQIKSGKISLADKITVSTTAWKKGGSKMFLEPGSKVRVVDLIKGIAVSSGNDASIAVAEYIAGSEKDFVALMNAKAKEFGMSKTNFLNATGWDNKGHVSTASDLAILGERIIKDFPEFYKVFKLHSFKYNGIRQINKNTLLGELGVDGLKTGHVEAIGYNIISSAKQNQARYLVVLLGANSKEKRESEVRKLYEFAYSAYKNVKILDSNSIIAQTKVYLGKNKIINLGVKDDLFENLTEKEFKSLKSEITYYPIVNAPVQYGDVLGEIKISYEGNLRGYTFDLISKDSSPTISGFNKIKEMFNYKYNKETYFN
jgi:serine-type D-Ala-D-Ala carboxypeptidase (penicillin-binding protein 5/6)